MKNSILFSLVMVLLALLIWLIFFFKPVEQAVVDAPPRGGDFVLVGSEGEVALADFRGKVVVLYFGYTWCPDICPTSLGVLSMALNELSAEELEQVQTLFVSVDPERDTPERLATYVGYFHENMLGLTGSKAVLDKVVSQYGAAYRKVVDEDSAMGYLMDHSASLYLIDRNGGLAGTLIHGTPPQEVLTHLRELIYQ